MTRQEAFDAFAAGCFLACGFREAKAKDNADLIPEAMRLAERHRVEVGTVPAPWRELFALWWSEQQRARTPSTHVEGGSGHCQRCGADLRDSETEPLCPDSEPEQQRGKQQ